MGGPHAIRRGRKSLKFPEEEETPPAADGGHAPPAASPLPGSAACRRPALRILHLPVPICARASFLEHSSLSLSLYIYIHANNPLALFLWRTLLPNLPTQGIPSLLGKLASKRNFRSQTRQNGSKCQRLVGAIPQSAHPEAYKADTSGGFSSPGAVAVEKDSFARYLFKPLAGARRERAGASPASPAEAEGRDACSGAGAGRSAWGAAGEVLGTQRENYSQGN